MPLPKLRPAPLPRFAIEFRRLPAGLPHSVVLEGPTLESTARTLRRFLGDDAPDRPATYRLTCGGKEIPSPFIADRATATTPITFKPAQLRCRGH